MLLLSCLYTSALTQLSGWTGCFPVSMCKNSSFRLFSSVISSSMAKNHCLTEGMSIILLCAEFTLGKYHSDHSSFLLTLPPAPLALPLHVGQFCFPLASFDCATPYVEIHHVLTWPSASNPTPFTQGFRKFHWNIPNNLCSLICQPLFRANLTQCNWSHTRRPMSCKEPELLIFNCIMTRIMHLQVSLKSANKKKMCLKRLQLWLYFIKNLVKYYGCSTFRHLTIDFR